MNCPHCGRRIVVEQVATSARDSRVEDSDAIPTDLIRSMGEAAQAVITAGEAAQQAGRALQTGTAAVARIEVQRERHRRSSQTIPAVKPEDKP